MITLTESFRIDKSIYCNRNQNSGCLELRVGNWLGRGTRELLGLRKNILYFDWDMATGLHAFVKNHWCVYLKWVQLSYCCKLCLCKAYFKSEYKDFITLKVSNNIGYFPNSVANLLLTWIRTSLNNNCIRTQLKIKRPPPIGSFYASNNPLEILKIWNSTWKCLGFFMDKRVRWHTCSDLSNQSCFHHVAFFITLGTHPSLYRSTWAYLKHVSEKIYIYWFYLLVPAVQVCLTHGKLKYLVLKLFQQNVILSPSPLPYGTWSIKFSLQRLGCCLRLSSR